MVHFYGIYGMGAIFIIIMAQFFNKNNITLFVGGYIIGSLTEYICSFLIEVIMNATWWNYSNYILNINGRICLLYSLFWGFLTILLIKKFNPFIDKILKRLSNIIPNKISKVLISLIIIFLFLDCLATCYAQDIFITKTVVENKIETQDFQERNEKYKNIKKNKLLCKIIDKYWNEKKMIMTFPNMKIKDINNNIIYMDSLYPNIPSYYLKICEPKI